MSRHVASWIDEIHTVYKEVIELKSMMEQFKAVELNQTMDTCIGDLLF